MTIDIQEIMLNVDFLKINLNTINYTYLEKIHFHYFTANSRHDTFYFNVGFKNINKLF